MDPSARTLAYKVVEVATVDEASLEHTVNAWVRRGWRLENVQFAMRESSRRPSMAFVFFTREEDPGAVEGGGDGGGEEVSEARARLARLAEHGPTAHRAQGGEPRAPGRPATSAWERLRQLAGEDGEGSEE